MSALSATESRRSVAMAKDYRLDLSASVAPVSLGHLAGLSGLRWASDRPLSSDLSGLRQAPAGPLLLGPLVGLSLASRASVGPLLGLCGASAVRASLRPVVGPHGNPSGLCRACVARACRGPFSGLRLASDGPLLFGPLCGRSLGLTGLRRASTGPVLHVDR